MVAGSRPVAVTKTSNFAPASSKKFLDIQASKEFEFILQPVRELISTYSQVNRRDKYSHHSSIFLPASLNG